MMVRTIRVQPAPFQVADEYQKLKAVANTVGAVTMFVGIVRDINDKAAVSTLHLEHYPGMTEKEIGKILDAAENQWSLIATTVIHRVGLLKPGDDIVFVGVAGAHRGDAFKASEFVIDYLKTRATFWKKEQTDQGVRWLRTRESDLETARAWRTRR